MKFIIILLGIVLFLFGAFLLFYPEVVLTFIEDNIHKPSFFIGATTGRFLIGFLLVASANRSAYPFAIKVIGYLNIISAIILIFLGQAGFHDFVSSILPVMKSYVSIPGILITALGAFLVYAYIMGRSPLKK